jgi:hypothetical protein
LRRDFITAGGRAVLVLEADVRSRNIYGSSRVHVELAERGE